MQTCTEGRTCEDRVKKIVIYYMSQREHLRTDPSPTTFRKKTLYQHHDVTIPDFGTQKINLCGLIHEVCDTLLCWP